MSLELEAAQAAFADAEARLRSARLEAAKAGVRQQLEELVRLFEAKSAAGELHEHQLSSLSAYIRGCSEALNSRPAPWCEPAAPPSDPWGR